MKSKEEKALLKIKKNLEKRGYTEVLIVKVKENLYNVSAIEPLGHRLISVTMTTTDFVRLLL